VVLVVEVVVVRVVDVVIPVGKGTRGRNVVRPSQGKGTSGRGKGVHGVADVVDVDADADADGGYRRYQR